MDVQAIYVRSYSIVRGQGNSKPFVLYTIEVSTKLRSFEVRRRYSEFEELWNELKTGLGSDLARRWLPALPPKTTTLMGYFTGSNKILAQPEKLAERQAGLERWLKTILVHKELKGHTARNKKLMEFLELDLASKSAGPSDSNEAHPITFTSQTWLTDYNETRSSIQEIYDIVSRRDESLQKNTLDSKSSTAIEVNRINLDAKKLLASVNSRVGSLADGLQQLSKPKDSKGKAALTDGEVSRRAKLISSLQDDCERLGKMTVLARSDLGAGFHQGSKAILSDSSSRDRLELLGRLNGRPTTRVLGSPSGLAGDSPPQETSETRQLNNRQLMETQLNETITKAQDSKLRSLTKVLLRQKRIGLMINQELLEQNEILDELTSNVDVTSNKLKEARKKIDILS
ncbi:hypothetical protein BY996DRAFT_6429786 [Phakopsora pachyrhizi]|uniref:Uncharacterized protein n=1 Tax=Phakopsora pachyrhizi TaxID=170000 RepID=A0AAV0AU44_PHAPC|nr:hypothetical protein BY996DRAFT_6429786 [Phakopsora pachyrhizi]CAH7671483.1 hypothetical protein PPACK8108_LOCUS6260 [Phakopsora pachyrhizi]